MKKIINLLIILITTLCASSVLAYNPPDKPANGAHVLDLSGKLSTTEIQNLENKINDLNTKTNNEFGILLLSTMDGNNIEDVAHATFNHWGIGKKDLDNGCLIVVSLKERKSRIETGKGVGGEITDIEANEILNKHLNPHLKKEHYYQGFDRTLDAVSSKLEARANGEEKSDGIGWIGILLIILLIIFIIWLCIKFNISFSGGSSSGGSWGGSSGGSSFGGGSSGGGGSSSDF